MKKAVVLIGMVVLCVMGAQAQYSQEYYHRTGDTIQYNTPIYYHNWWGFETSYVSHGKTAGLTYMAQVGQKLLSYYFTPNPLKVIGMALFYPVRYDLSFCLPQIPDSLLIFEATPESLYEVASVQWNPTDDTTRYLHLRGRTPQGLVYGGAASDESIPCCDGMRWDAYIPVTEYYFDNPVYVMDSFYVGVTDNSTGVGSSGDAVVYNPPLGHVYAWNNYPVDCEEGLTMWENPYCMLSWPTIRFGYPALNTAGLYANTVVYENFYLVPMVFPIIQVDTTVPPEEYCPAVQNLQVRNLGGGTVEATWDAHPDHRFGYEVQYGLLGQPLSAWATTYSEQNFMQLPGLSIGQYYSLRVRPMCGEEKMDTGSWCNTVIFMPTDTADAGIEGPSALAQHTWLSPNPATERVTVTSDYVILSLDLYDAAGRHLWNHAVGRRSETLDLSSHAAGRYLLMVTTPQGTTPKVLVKQ